MVHEITRVSISDPVTDLDRVWYTVKGYWINYGYALV